MPPWNEKEIANLILSWGKDDGIDITPLKLQKLIYFCHVDFLKRFDVPLVSGEFQAWKFGPVLPSVYEEFSNFSGKNITCFAERFDPVAIASVVEFAKPEGDALDCIRQSYKGYSKVSASALSNLSHEPCGAWFAALQLFESGRNFNRVISNDLIKNCQISESN